MVPQWIIEKKRDGHALGPDEIRTFINGYARGDIPDYQMAALAMAIFFRGMSDEEVTLLTEAMIRSGDRLDTSSLPAPVADKHSTGGIGDKVSLVLAPLAAACGLSVPMISGRGLGITGGTLDKLESIPGYRTRLAVDEILAVVRDCGCSIVGQTERLAPADRKLYALRDVTGTVPSIPLISASIMSKKLAEGIGALTLDVKWGSGAFMKTRNEARLLAQTMVEIGNRMGCRTAALVTDMNQPLGCAAGNALEVAETVAALRGNGPPDLMELTFALTAQMLALTGRAASPEAARPVVEQQLASGAALERFRRMVVLHGGDPAFIDDPARLPVARLQQAVPAPAAGYVARADADRIGRACLLLGAGRTRVDDAVDPAVGAAGIRKVGERVQAGEALCVLHANDETRLADAMAEMADAFTVHARRHEPPPLVVETIA